MAGEVTPADPRDLRSHWTPGAITSFQIIHFEGLQQLQGLLDPVDVVTLELDQIEDAGGLPVTEAAHARATRVICYTSSGFEDWRADAASYPEDAKGGPICQDDGCRSTWPGEAWGDIRQPSLQAFLATRADRASAIGCDGIEFDNIDQAFNQTGLNVSRDENIAAARELARIGHGRGLAVLAKNAGEIASAIAPLFDGVFIEECHQNDECDAYLPFAGKLVAMIEYEADCAPHDWAVCHQQDDYFEESGEK